MYETVVMNLGFVTLITCRKLNTLSFINMKLITPWSVSKPYVMEK